MNVAITAESNETMTTVNRGLFISPNAVVGEVDEVGEVGEVDDEVGEVDDEVGEVDDELVGGQEFNSSRSLKYFSPSQSLYVFLTPTSTSFLVESLNKRLLPPYLVELNS